MEVVLRLLIFSFLLFLNRIFTYYFFSYFQFLIFILKAKNDLEKVLKEKTWDDGVAMIENGTNVHIRFEAVILYYLIIIIIIIYCVFCLFVLEISEWSHSF